MKRIMKKAWLSLLMATLIVGQFGFLGTSGQVANAAEETTEEVTVPDKAVFAEKPYMGWSSYSLQVYDGPGNWTSAEAIKKQSDAMREKLQPYGYNYINIDAGWNGSMDEYGRPIPSTVLYPNGFEEVVDYVHNNGQKIGLYFIPGLSKEAYDKNLQIKGTSCHMQDIAVQPLKLMDYWNSYTYKIDFTNPCATKYIESIADLLGEWGVNFVKFDSVMPGSGENNLDRDAREDVKAWYEALSKHNIWFELSWALDHNYVDWWKKYSHGWRIHWDIEAYDHTKGMVEWATIARLFPEAAIWWRDAGPGGWNDFDSLNVGNGTMNGLTKDERKTAMTFWSISAAQLYIGDDMTRLDDYGLELLTNKEVIAVNQAGRPGHPVSMDTQQQVWYSNNGDGTFNVALFNLDAKTAPVTVNWSEIGLDGEASVRDLWSGKELGTYATGYTDASLEPHASRLFKVTAKNGFISTNNDDTGMKYDGSWVRNGGKELEEDSQNLTIAIKETLPANIEADEANQPVQEQGEAAETGEEKNSDNPAVVEEAQEGADTTANKTEEASRDSAADTGNVINEDQAATETDIAPETSEDPAVIEDEQVSNEQVISNTEEQVEVIAEPFERSFIINNDDPKIFYSGKWGRSTGRGYGDYKDDVQYAEKPGDFFEYTFKGTGIQYITEIDPSQGKVDIYLNGEFKETIDTYSSDRKAQQVVYSVSGLPNGLHTLKAVMRDGRFMLLDALKVELPTLINPSAAEFDLNPENQADLHIGVEADIQNLAGIYNGKQLLEADIDYTLTGNEIIIKKEYLAAQAKGEHKLRFQFSGDFHNDVHFTKNDGDAVAYTFKGTGAELLLPTGPEQGEMNIYMDGVLSKIVNAHSTARKSQQSLFKVSGLASGNHTIKIEKKSGELMLIDKLRFEVAKSSTNPNPGTGGGGGWYSPSASTENISGQLNTGDTNTIAVNIVRTTENGVKKDAVTLTKELAQKAADQLAANGGKLAGIQIPDAKDEVAQTKATFNKDALGILAALNLGLSLDTRHAKLELPNASVQNWNEDVVFDLKPVRSTQDQQALQDRANQSELVKAAFGDSKVTVIGVPVKIDTKLQNREVNLFLPLPAGEPANGSSIWVYIEHSDGTKEFKAGKVATQNNVKGIAFTTNKFSTFALMKGEGAKAGDHTAYIQGYPGGLFKPENGMTRAEIATVLSRIAHHEEKQAEQTYSDVPASYWAAKAIAEVSKMGLMKGFADGSFKPDQAVTRAELASIAAVFTSEAAQIVKPGQGFTDTASHWAEQAIKQVQGQGLINGYADGTFRPDKLLTRGETVALLNRMLGRGPLAGLAQSPWSDVAATHWAAGDIAEASVDHKFDLTADGKEQIAQ